MATRPGSRTKLQILANILRLEARKGYVNEVVTGGLDKFLELASDELTPVVSDLPGYAGMTPAERREWAEGVMRRIAKAIRRTARSGAQRSQTAASDGHRRRCQPPVSPPCARTPPPSASAAPAGERHSVR